MNIELRKGKIFIDGIDTGSFYRSGCSGCGVSASIKWNEGGTIKIYALRNRSDEAVIEAIKTLVCKNKSLRESKQFAEELLQECERCINEENLVLVEK